MPTSQKTQQIVASFQRYGKTQEISAISTYSVEDLKNAVRDLGWRDTGIQSAINDRISILERKSERRNQSFIRAVGYIVALSIAIIAAILSAKYI